MNKEVKKLWVEALRSGKYEQGRGCLRKGDKFCCLGVLCDLNEPSWNTRPEISLSIYWHKDEENNLPSDEIMSWAGLLRSDCSVLAILNDSGRKSFSDIAEYIEENL